MDKNEILEMAKEYGLPFEVEQDGIEFIWIYDKDEQRYLRLHDQGGVWYARVFGVPGLTGLVNDQIIVNCIKELAA